MIGAALLCKVGGLWPWSLFCRAFGHAWRRPHKHENANCRICKRCGIGRPIRKRKAAA